MLEFCMGDRVVGLAHVPFIVSEVGINHEGEIDKAIHCPNIDVVKRHKRRLHGNSVITTEYDRDQIKAAIEKCLFDAHFKEFVENRENSYGAGPHADRRQTYPKKMTY